MAEKEKSFQTAPRFSELSYVLEHNVMQHPKGTKWRLLAHSKGQKHDSTISVDQAAEKAHEAQNTTDEKPKVY